MSLEGESLMVYDIWQSSLARNGALTCWSRFVARSPTMAEHIKSVTLWRERLHFPKKDADRVSFGGSEAPRLTRLLFSHLRPAAGASAMKCGTPTAFGAWLLLPTRNSIAVLID